MAVQTPEVAEPQVVQTSVAPQPRDDAVEAARLYSDASRSRQRATGDSRRELGASFKKGLTTTTTWRRNPQLDMDTFAGGHQLDRITATSFQSQLNMLIPRRRMR